MQDECRTLLCGHGIRNLKDWRDFLLRQRQKRGSQSARQDVKLVPDSILSQINTCKEELVAVGGQIHCPQPQTPPAASDEEDQPLEPPLRRPRGYSFSGPELSSPNQGFAEASASLEEAAAAAAAADQEAIDSYSVVLADMVGKLIKDVQAVMDEREQQVFDNGLISLASRRRDFKATLDEDSASFQAVLDTLRDIQSRHS